MLKRELVPLVTIGVINYNHILYIDECINSILNQDYPNIEILIIDDCSNDGCIEKIKEYEEKYSNVKAIYHKVNSGNFSVACKEIIENASGEYFLFCASDDYYGEDNAISLYINEFLKNENIDYIYSDLKLVDSNRNYKCTWKYNYVNKDDVILATFRKFGSGKLPMTGMFKKSFYYKNSLKWIVEKDNKISADTFNSLYNIKNNMNFKYVDYLFTCYRQHDNNISLNVKESIKSVICILEFVVKNFDESIFFPEVKWDSYELRQKECIKNYLLGKYYANAYIYFINEWNLSSNENFEKKEQNIFRYSNIIKEKSISYFEKSLIINKKFLKVISKICKDLNDIKCIGDINDIKKLCNNFLDVNTKKIIIFGTGNMSDRIMSKVSLPVDYFIDNDKKKNGSEFHGVLVKSIKEIQKETKEEFLIIIASSYYYEISKQLINLGFDETKDFINGEIYL